MELCRAGARVGVGAADRRAGGAPPGPGPLALGGFFKLQEAEQGKCLDVKDASTAENAVLQRISRKGNDAHLRRLQGP